MSLLRSTDRLTRARHFLGDLPGSVVTFWRRSLRTRVVTAIVVLSAVVVGSVGWLVLSQITDGLVKSRVQASVAEARTETSTARERSRRRHWSAFRRLPPGIYICARSARIRAAAAS